MENLTNLHVDSKVRLHRLKQLDQHLSNIALMVMRDKQQSLSEIERDKFAESMQRMTGLWIADKSLFDKTVEEVQ